MSKLLITGGSGFIGYHFHQYFPQAQITNIDLVPPNLPLQSTYINGDIRIRENVEQAIEKSQCETILNLAGVHNDFGRTREEYFDTNERGTKVLCEAATKYNIKNIILYSSVAVYGNKPTPTHEKMIPTPSNPYGASKLAAEEVVKKWAAADKQRSVLIMRPVVIYGEQNTANMYRLIDQIQKGRYVHIGNADVIKSIGYVKNLVEATKFLMERLQSGVHIYNFADEPQLSSRVIAETIIRALGKKNAPTLPYWLVYLMGLPFDLAIKITGKDLPISTNRINKFCSSTHHGADKLKTAGFSPKWTNEEGLTNMVKWYLGNKKVGSEDSNFKTISKLSYKKGNTVDSF